MQEQEEEEIERERGRRGAFFKGIINSLNALVQCINLCIAQNRQCVCINCVVVACVDVEYYAILY